jgi:prophage regulatory protein
MLECAIFGTDAPGVCRYLIEMEFDMSEVNFEYGDQSLGILSGMDRARVEQCPHEDKCVHLASANIAQEPIRSKRLIKKSELFRRTEMRNSGVYERLNPNSKRYDPDFPKQVRISNSASSNSSGVRRVSSEVDAWIELQIAKRDALLVRQKQADTPSLTGRVRIGDLVHKICRDQQSVAARRSVQTTQYRNSTVGGPA